MPGYRKQPAFFVCENCGARVETTVTKTPRWCGEKCRHEWHDKNDPPEVTAARIEQRRKNAREYNRKRTGYIPPEQDTVKCAMAECDRFISLERLRYNARYCCDEHCRRDASRRQDAKQRELARKFKEAVERGAELQNKPAESEAAPSRWGLIPAWKLRILNRTDPITKRYRNA